MTAPPETAYLIWAGSLAVGFALGRYQERHKETMNMRNLANAYVQWYSRRAPVMVTAIAILALVGIWIGTSATITNGRQEARADATNKAVQACFDRYAQAQSASSKAVREASAKKDEATALRDRIEAERDDALNREGQAFLTLVEKLETRSGTLADIKRLRDTLEERDNAGRRLDRAQAAVEVAQDELDKARRENPVPDAPSEFCSVKP